MTRGKSKTRAAAAIPDRRLTPEEACDALGIPPELLDAIAREADVPSDPDGRFDPFALAAAAVRYGRTRAEAADRRLTEVGAALSEVKPALARLAGLADRAELSGDARTRVMVEVAAFFNAFAAVMNRATATLKSGE